jgi:adenine-specific DNA-methyltransferase
MPSDAFEALRAHLREMFQFDNSELDFGIYKVLKLKRRDVERFIDEELPALVADALQTVETQQYEQNVNQLTAFVKEKGGDDEKAMLSDVPGHREELEEFIHYKKPADEGKLLTALNAVVNNDTAEELETRIYNHILRFFQRYYRDGDFGYNDRSIQSYQVDYTAEAEYDGSDVLFHWKHKDSYYIKTGQGFHSVAFEIDGERIKYVVERVVDDVQVRQNNNKDDRKHYELNRIEQAEDGTWHVVFHLAKMSTSKVCIFKEMSDTIFGDDLDYNIFLFRGEDNPIFTDLEGDYDEVSGGKKKGSSGRSSLRLAAEKYCERLVKSHRDVFKELGNNDDERVAALVDEIEGGAEGSPVRRFYTFDKHLNTFYIGQDSDYFIHKHLKRFLDREKNRYVRNTIFSDLDAILDMRVDNTSVVIAKAFNQVTGRIIDFLATVEEFQKNLFLLKKKVISTDYLISVGKISDLVEDRNVLRGFMDRIVSNDAQMEDWQATFAIEPPGDPTQLIVNYPTLPVDTAHFQESDPTLKEDLLAYVDNLEEDVDGLLMNSENFQALRLLARTYRRKIAYEYLDPPYNTGPSEILYKNDFRNSSWLSLMGDRLMEGEKLLAESEGVCTIAIDDFELAKLCELADRIFKDYDRNMVVVNHHPQGAGGDNISRTHEYALFMTPADTDILRGGKTEDDEIEERPFMRSGTGDRNFRYGRPNSFYALHVDPETKEVISVGPCLSKNETYLTGPTDDGLLRVYPIGGDGSERVWRNYYETGKKLVEAGDILCTEKLAVYKLVRDKKKAVFSNWTDKKYNAGTYGTSLIADILGDAKLFSYPKSVFTVVDSIRAVTHNKPNAICLDYFAGSGTTGQAILKLNKEDEGDRKFILVEMGEYFDGVLKERIRRVMYSENWTEGRPDGTADGTVGIVKYQRLEQYEDVLNSLQVHDDEEPLPDGVPLTYLYRPQEQAVRTSLDLREPFGQRITYGPEQEEATLDLLETYAYLKGLPVQQKRRYEIEGRVYRTVRSGRNLVVFRSVSDGEDDTDALRTILDENEGVEVLHVNYDLQQGRLEGPRLNVRVVTADDFDAGTTWN